MIDANQSPDIQKNNSNPISKEELNPISKKFQVKVQYQSTSIFRKTRNPIAASPNPVFCWTTDPRTERKTKSWKTNCPNPTKAKPILRTRPVYWSKHPEKPTTWSWSFKKPDPFVDPKILKNQKPESLKKHLPKSWKTKNRWWPDFKRSIQKFRWRTSPNYPI